MKQLLLAVVLVFSGCMSFNNGRVPRVELKAPARESPTVACVATRFGRTFNGKAPPSRALMDDQTASNMVVSQICRLWKQDRLIGEWGAPGDLHDPDYTLQVSGEFNESGSMLASVITGLTLFLFPSSSNMEVDVRAKLRDNKTGREYEAHSINSWSMWMHILFLPTFPLSGLGTLHAQRDQARHLYQQLETAGAFAREDLEGRGGQP